MKNHAAFLATTQTPESASELRPVNVHRTQYIGAQVRQRGLALVTSMLILIMLTLLAVAMFRGFGLQQKIAGNVREKERAFQAAESALQYAEEWLIAGPRGSGAPCAATNPITTFSDMRVCISPLATVADPGSWTGASTYTPKSMIVFAGGGIATDGNSNKDINYAATPKLYVAYLGVAPDNPCGVLYSVSAAGYGGSNNSIAVLQSIVERTNKICTP